MSLISYQPFMVLLCLIPLLLSWLWQVEGAVSGLPSYSATRLARREILNIGSPVSPKWRALHVAVMSGDYMVVYGGIASNKGFINQPGTSDVFVYYTKDGRWYKPKMLNAPTAGQRMHSGAAIDESSILFYATNTTGTNADKSSPVTILNTASWSWLVANRDVSTPLSRVGQSFTLVGPKIYMYGGSTQNPDGTVNSGSINNDLVTLDTASRVWSGLTSSYSRQGHSACYFANRNAIVVFGGMDNTLKAVNQLSLFNTQTATWDPSPVIETDKVTTSRYTSITTMLIGGGSNEDGRSSEFASNDVWVLEAPDNQIKYVWTRPVVKNMGNAPSSRMGHSAVLTNNRILFWGGVSDEVDMRMYALDIDTWSWSHADVDTMLPPPGAADQKEDAKDSNGKVVVIVATVCALVGLLAIVAFIVIGLRKKRARKMNRAQTSGSSVAVINGRATGTNSAGNKTLLRKETIDSTSFGSQSPSSMNHPSLLTVGGRAMATSETNSPRDSNGDLSTAAASDPTPRVHRSGRRRVGRTANTSTNIADDDDDDVDRWTFASSISFGQNTNASSRVRISGSNNNDTRAARYYPPLAALPRSRSMSQAVFRANIPPASSMPTSEAVPITQVISPPMSPNLQPGSVISGMVSPLDQIARLRLNQMKRVGENGGNGPSTEATSQEMSTAPAIMSIVGDAAVPATENVSEESSQKSNESSNEQVQVRGGDARESVEGYLFGSAGSRSVIEPTTVYEESTESQDNDDEDKPADTKNLHRHPTLVRIGSDVFRPGSVLFNRYILLDRPAPNLATDAVVVYAADDTAGEMVVIKMFVSRTAWEREYVALRFLRSPQVAALRNIYNLADERTGTERYVLVTERYGRALPELLSKLDDNGDLDSDVRAGLARSVTECLSTCHSQGLVIGDLTPASFAQSSDDTPKCKLVSLERIRRPGEEWSSDSCLTTRYCAPEVAEAVRDQAKLIAAATVDLWSLGCIIYEIFAEKPLLDIAASDEEVHAFLMSPTPGAKLGHVTWSADRVLMPDDLNERIPDESARLAVASLLSYNPSSRLAAIEVLKSF
ncbi:hypothetical protein BDF19DRAFT_451326 [Syncephalis fuscata]|nr:hypothetical protein BDF19DRAFT_451326 [Syncephalis fuscata]